MTAELLHAIQHHLPHATIEFSHVSYPVTTIHGTTSPANDLTIDGTFTAPHGIPTHATVTLCLPPITLSHTSHTWQPRRTADITGHSPYRPQFSFTVYLSSDEIEMVYAILCGWRCLDDSIPSLIRQEFTPARPATPN